MANAQDSLSHAVEHITASNGQPSPSDLKRAIQDVSHVVELILKERVRKIHPAFIWKDIDKYPSLEAQTIGTEKAVLRLHRLAGIVLPDSSLKTLMACRKIRNLIEHYEFEIRPEESKAIVGRMLSFIFDFSKNVLEIDMETAFREDERWLSLIEIYEFSKVHSTLLEEQAAEEGRTVRDCPSCGADTFDLDLSECIFCGHTEEEVECDGCKELFWQSELTSCDVPYGENSYEILLCDNCMHADYDDIGD